MNDFGWPGWSAKPLAEMLPQEIADAIHLLEAANHDDQALIDALTRQLRRSTLNVDLSELAA